MYTLLTDGGYNGLEDVEFPIEVEGNPDPDDDSLIEVSGHTLNSIGATEHFFIDDWPYAFSIALGEIK